MGRESHALMAGLFLLILGSTVVLVSYWLGQYGNENDSYIVTTQSAVSGLKPESTVYYRGVEAGKVAGMQFDPKDTRTILVSIKVFKGIPITSATFARLRVQPLTGLAQIELDNSTGSSQPLPTSDAAPARIPLRPSLVDILANSGQDLVTQTDQLLIRFNDLLGDDNRGHMKELLRNLADASERLAMLESKLDRSLADLPALSADARKTLSQFGRLAEELSSSAQQLKAVGRLGEGLTQATLPRLNNTLDDLRAAAVQVNKLSTQLNADPQALLLGAPVPRPGPGEPGYASPR